MTRGSVRLSGGLTTFAASFFSPESIAFFSPRGAFLSGMSQPRAFANAVVQSPATLRARKTNESQLGVAEAGDEETNRMCTEM